jgi:hypothetical protein
MAFLVRVVAVIEESPVNVPTVQEIADKLVTPPQAVAEILRLGERAGDVLDVSGRYYTPAQLSAIAEQLAAEGEPLSPARIREMLQTTRRHAEPLIAFFDELGITVRRDGLRTVELDAARFGREAEGGKTDEVDGARKQQSGSDGSAEGGDRGAGD